MTRRPVVAVLEGARPVRGLERVAELADIRVTKADGLAGALDGADVLYLWDYFSGALPAAWHAAGSLRWLHVAAAGVDKLLFPGLVSSDVTVTNAHGIFDQPMAEYVLGAVLHAAKGFGPLRDQQREAQWSWREGRNIAGTRAMVVGTGSIGRHTARLLRAVGVRVEGVGRTAAEDDEDFGRIHASGNLVRVVEDVDWLVLVAPLTPATVNLVSAEVIDAMKPSAVLINVGRGRLVDEDALVRRLRAGTLGGAVLDTFAVEPLPQANSLWSLPSVLVTPHMASNADSWLDDLAAQFERNFLLWVEGRALPGVVDKVLGYVPSGYGRA
ncbi:D-2-hydroxyacid dehydrogenase [Arthrobacter sp. NamB2]|uniref:D-2-hydroxyacid dehydrogenase n=1 Tax=Arthrobacter sp. NamB2 TaxID=2576035 RepID=UPI0010C97EAE|nr:D-2-hydroxyacid dehydrogenase [Arthrobacter sp. NamB2]TKV28459.1 D-2-hydroxyacid dehydrogenase [Arthrobacter sp. NamB2]